MKIAIGQINPIVGALRHNTDVIIQTIERARREGADLVVFPELAITGYPPMDLLDRDRFIRLNLECLDRIRQSTEGIAAIIGFVDWNPNRLGKRLFNAAALLKDGETVSVHYKCLLPTYDVFDEDRYFQPAREVHAINLKGMKIGITICEDIWNDADFWSRRLYDVDPVAELDGQGIEMMINISASPFALHKHRLRTEMLQNISRKYGFPTLYVNVVGGNDSLIFDGNSLLINAQGETVWQGRAFDTDFAVVNLDHALPPHEINWPNDMATIEKALILGVKDYMHKCGFKKAVLGLSGGIDSAVTAAIAAQALGFANVLGVSMPSPYSSQGSRDDAFQLAQNLGIGYQVVPIQRPFESFKEALLPIFEGLPEDVTEENLQARIRANILMAISNKFGHLLLTTGNKSEMAVGYCTLYGDMCGGLAVISDLPKTWVYQLAEYMNREREVIPWNTIHKPPSAELKPDQVDQDTLPPYHVLDAILEAYIVENKSPRKIIEMGHDATTVDWVIQRININEYKRRQAPPGLKVTHKAFGNGRRYPIARGHD